MDSTQLARLYEGDEIFYVIFSDSPVATFDLFHFNVDTEPGALQCRTNSVDLFLIIFSNVYRTFEEVILRCGLQLIFCRILWIYIGN